MRMRIRGVALAMLLLMVGSLATAQVTDENEPAPYEKEEFPDWMLSVRRAEIIATGTLPLTILASRIVFSLVRFTVESIKAGAIDPDYAPWFFAPPGAPPLTQAQKLGVVGGAIGLSVIIAWIDYAILSAEADSASHLDRSSGTE